MNTTFTNSSFTEVNGQAVIATIACVITIQVINFFVGLPLNCYIITLLLSKSGGVDVSIFFTLNHVSSEIILALVAPLYISCIISLDFCYGPLLGFWLGTFIPARYVFQCLVCLERYMAVIHPVSFLRYKPLRYRMGCAVVGWACALTLGILSMCMFPDLPYNMIGIVYLIIFLLDSFSCISILKGLLRPGPGDREKEDMNVAKKKAFKVVSMNLVTFLVQIIPMVVSFAMLGMVPQDLFLMGVAIGMVINISAGFVHPIFVLHKTGKLSFRKST